jgi:ATP-dependent helicase/nuclease subunit A
MVEAVADLKERIKAVITGNHAFINASAGTGKTHTLTLRAIYLLLTGEAQNLYTPSATRRELQKAARDSVRSLVLTTFTKKASAEMQARVFKYLNRITAAGGRAELEKDLEDSGDTLFLSVLREILLKVPGENFSLLQRGAQALIERAPELQISTLHSFANMLLSSYPVESGIPLDARFQSEDDPEGLDRESRLVDIWLQREVLEGNSELSGDLEKVLTCLTLDNLRKIFKESLLRGWLPEALRELTETTRKEGVESQKCLDALRAWSSAALKLKGNLSKAKRLAEGLEERISGVEQQFGGSWTSLAEFILKFKGYMFGDGKETPKAVIGMINELPDEYSSLLDDYRSLYRTALFMSLREDSAEAWASFIFLLQSFVGWGRENLVRETGLITFNDMISMAAGMLRENPGVQAREYSRLKSVLVDEFQDTDPDQLELLKNLITRPEECEHEVLGFFVGDVKQSIYRFRNADVSGVEDFQANYPKFVKCRKPVDHIRLQTSFRSDPRIIDFANHLFNGILNLERKGENLIPSRLPEQGVPEWRLVDSGMEKENALARRNSVARAVLAAVQEYVSEKGNHGGLPYEDILVLCRNYAELDPVIETLKRAGVPVISSGSRTFQMNTEVVDTINLLISLLDPLDSLSLASVLKSPVVGLSDAEIFRFFQEVDPLAVFSGREPVPGFITGWEREQLVKIGKLAEARRELGCSFKQDLPADEEIDEILQEVEADQGEKETEGLNPGDWISLVAGLVPAEAYHRDYDLEGISVTRIRKVLADFMAVVTDGAVPPLVWLLGERDKAVHRPMPDAGFSEDVSVADESVRAVRVMSIHKSKGLEGKYVILASWASLLESGLGLSGRNRSKVVYDFPQKGKSRARAFRFKWGRLDLESSNYPDVEESDRDLERKEVHRLAYVSVTRPRERLLMLTPASFVLENRPEAAEQLEAYLDEALSRNLLKKSTCLLGDLPEVSDFVSGSDEINPEAYWEIWSGRLSLIGKAAVKAQKTAISRDEKGEGGEDKGFPLFDVAENGAESSPEGSKIDTGRLVHLYLEHHLSENEFTREKLESLASIMDQMPADELVVSAAERILKRYYTGKTRDESGIPMVERVRNARIVAREFPVMLYFQDEPQYRIIDLLLEEGDGLTVVDFKTGDKSAVLPERYIKQQAAYTRAVEQLAEKRPVSFEFWWMG